MVWVKIKSYATIPLSISFPWAWEGKLPVSFFKSFKIPKVHLSDETLKMPLFRCTQCAYGALQNCPQITAFNTCILQIFGKFQAFPVTKRHKILHHHFSLWLQSRESTKKSTKPMKFQHFQLPKETKFGPHLFHSWSRPSDLTKSMQKDMNFSTFQRMHLMTPSKKHKNPNIKGSIFPLFHTILCPTANTQLAYHLSELFNSCLTKYTQWLHTN